MNTRFAFTALLLLLSTGLFSQDSQNVILLDNWQDDNLPTISHGIRYNEVWGFVHDGLEYAVIGSTMGTHIFRITDDDTFSEVAFVPGAFQGQVVHRDFHDYKGYLYGTCDQGTSTLQIIDLHLLPDTVELVYNSNELVTTAHNIFIDSTSALAYLAGPSGSPLRIISLEEPTQPTLVNNFFGPVSYVHDLYVRNDTAYLNAANQGLWVVNFADPLNPELLGSLTTYPDQGYNHSGWLSEDSQLYVFADENDGFEMKACDVSDLGNIEVLSTFASNISPNSVPHNLMLKDGIVYVSHYNDGLQIFDLTDPENPERIAWYDTFDGDISYSFNGAWGIYAFLPSGRLLISDRTSGLYLFRMDLTLSTAELKRESSLQVFPNPTSGPLTLRCNLAQITGLRIVNLAGQEVRSLNTTGLWRGDELLLDVGDLPRGLYVIEVRSETEVQHTRVLRY